MQSSSALSRTCCARCTWPNNSTSISWLLSCIGSNAISVLEIHGYVRSTPGFHMYRRLPDLRRHRPRRGERARRERDRGGCTQRLRQAVNDRTGLEGGLGAVGAIVRKPHSSSTGRDATSVHRAALSRSVEGVWGLVPRHNRCDNLPRENCAPNAFLLLCAWSE